MTLQAVVGQATSQDGHEAAMQAVHQALDRIGKNTVGFGFIVASHHYSFPQILNGITPLLGDTPLLGISTTSVLAPEAAAGRSVVVTLISGNELQARSDWIPGYDTDSREATRKLLQSLLHNQNEGVLLVVADGQNGDARQLCDELPAGNYFMAGCLAGGDIRRGNTSQLGGNKAGTGGLAAAYLSGEFTFGIGYGHAWQPVGTYFSITRVKGPMVITLNHKPVNEVYSRLFGYTPLEWTQPPLNELVRLYPLGIEQEGKSELLIYSPLQFDDDGSLRMNASIPEGSVGHPMTGGIEQCLASVKDACRQAIVELGESRPVLAFVFADTSIKMLLEAQQEREISAIRSVLGGEVPVVGGYTFGQLVRSGSRPPELLNQHIMVIVLGEKSA